MAVVQPPVHVVTPVVAAVVHPAQSFMILEHESHPFRSNFTFLLLPHAVQVVVVPLTQDVQSVIASPQALTHSSLAVFMKFEDDVQPPVQVVTPASDVEHPTQSEIIEVQSSHSVFSRLTYLFVGQVLTQLPELKYFPVSHVVHVVTSDVVEQALQPLKMVAQASHFVLSALMNVPSGQVATQAPELIYVLSGQVLTHLPELKYLSAIQPEHDVDPAVVVQLLQSVIALVQETQALFSEFTNVVAEVVHVRQLSESSHVAHPASVLAEVQAWFETTNNSARVKNKMMFFLVWFIV